METIQHWKKFILKLKTMAGSRKASHAGSWYSSSCKELKSQLGNWLENANVKAPAARAIIAPHAGYSFCGECGAYAYKLVDPESIERVFILGPSHHVYLAGCALTQTLTYETPLYNLTVDTKMNEELLATGKFEKMNIATDEDEHSIEMHLPYIAKVMESRKDDFKVVPVLVGSTSHEKERMYGEIFSKYLNDPKNLFVISSDFCHWGKRFRYTYYDKSKGNIHDSIEDLDKMGMGHIANLDTSAYYSYLDRYSNTICGRHPIGILLNAVDQLDPQKKLFEFKFHKYAQSSKVMRSDDSSVSYASGALVVQ